MLNVGGPKGVAGPRVLKMASDPALIPLQIRRNNEDMQEMLKSLNSWENEMKKRDDLLKKQKPILKKVLINALH